MREILKLAGNLFTITAVAAILLGLTNMATADTIEQQLIQENIDARVAVLPIATDFQEIENPEIESAIQSDFQDIEEIYEGIKDNEVVGYTFKTVPNGYSGEIVMNVGISIDYELSGVKVVSHSETPGLGANAAEDYFQNQYKGKPIDIPFEVVKTTPDNENEIEAITGATVTANAVTNGVNLAIDLYYEYIE